MSQLFDDDYRFNQVSLFDSIMEDGNTEETRPTGMPKYLFYDDEYANSSQYICSVGYICTDEQGNELFSHYELIDPECEFGFFETKKHGITAADVAGKKNFKEFCDDAGFIEILRNCIFVAHNAQSADLTHIRKSLAHYGVEMPIVRAVDTQAMAGSIDGLASCSLEDVCSYYGVSLENHHNAYEDALACKEIFWLMLDDLGGGYNAEVYVPGASKVRAPKRSRPNGSLGLVCGSEQTIEELLDEFDSQGLLADIDEIISLGPCAMKFSGTANGMSSDEIECALQARGYGSGAKKTVDGKPGKKTVFFAVGDNVGPSKIKAAKDNGTRVVALVDLLDALGI